MKIIRPMTPLHRRMREDMQIRNFSPHTIDGYLRYVGQFATHFGVSPDQLGAEHLRTSQLHLLQHQASESIVIQTVCGLRFLYETTLHRPWMVDDIPYPKKPKKLPVILSRDEVTVLMQAPRHLKHRLILATLSTTGVRAAELCQLQGATSTPSVWSSTCAKVKASAIVRWGSRLPSCPCCGNTGSAMGSNPGSFRDTASPSPSPPTASGSWAKRRAKTPRSQRPSTLIYFVTRTRLICSKRGWTCAVSNCCSGMRPCARPVSISTSPTQPFGARRDLLAP